VDNRQKTLLHNVASNGDIGILRALIKANADLNILDKDDCTPLCVAVREN
jgi:ankyrin repeat protein